MIMAMVYKFQSIMIFRPIKLEKNYQFQFDVPYEELWLGNMKSVNALLFTVSKPRGVVLYHHGNSRNIQHWGNFYTDFTRRGYDVLFYDYRGFGKSKGLLTENSLYRDARICYQYLRTQYPKEEIFQFGRSLGSALATRMALRYGSKFLVLETPYLSMKAMAQKRFPILPISWLIQFPLRQDIDIIKINCPILILSGSSDELTPHNHSLTLSKLNKKTELVVLKNGMHNGLTEYPEYQKALDRYYGEMSSDYIILKQ
jgi:alpha-beta hydrolase superfamily lysophospholipase